jgi:hypothetical protein
MTATVTAEEMAACLGDKRWRLNNLMLILPEDDEDGGLIPFVMRAEQEQFLRERHTRNFVPKARKLGMSTLIVLDNFDEALTVPNTHCAIVDYREDDALKKLDIARRAWKDGPKHPNPVIAHIWAQIHKGLKLVKDTTERLEWSNGSCMEASTSFMGGTPRRIHWSEAGPQSAHAPDRARKVKRGTLNAIGAHGVIDVETTMEGGEGTPARDLFDLALSMVGKPLSRMDWKLHFFPWYGHPSYDLTGHAPETDEVLKYAAEMQEKHGIKIPASRWAWYEKKRQEQKDDVWTQFPTIAEEAIRVVVSGQIFPQVVTVKSKGRVRPLTVEANRPLWSFWDIGNDGLSCWVGQQVFRDILWHRFFFTTGAGAVRAAEVIRQFEQELGLSFSTHFFPHDVDYRDRGSSVTYRSQLVTAGVPNHKIITIPIAGDKWDGINAVRDRIPRMWFDPACEKAQIDAFGEKLPSGLGCLTNYRTQPKAASGALRALPLHDVNSHGADAMVTFGAADEQGYLVGNLRADETPRAKRHGTVAVGGLATSL